MCLISVGLSRPRRPYTRTRKVSRTTTTTSILLLLILLLQQFLNESGCARGPFPRCELCEHDASSARVVVNSGINTDYGRTERDVNVACVQLMRATKDRTKPVSHVLGITRRTDHQRTRL